MSMASGGGRQLSAEINVTPLIDVLLVLLIIFMVITPSVVSGLDTLLPQPPKSPNPIHPDEPIVVQVFGDQQHRIVYKINESSFSKSDLEPKLAEIFAARTDKVMFIKGDPDLDFSFVADVIDYGHQAGVNNIGIMTPRSSSR